MMNQLKIKYDTSAIVLPGRVTEVLDRASVTDLKVLMILCASPDLCRDTARDGWAAEVASAADCDEDGVRSALAFWRGAGMLTESTAKTKEAKKRSRAEDGSLSPVKEEISAKAEETSSVPVVSEPAQTPKLRPKDELPHYTTEQLVHLLESQQETAAWLNECQRIFGKIFKTVEVNSILGFVDYLGLEWEYVVSLLAYYVEVQERRQMPKSIRGVEKMAFDFYDKGIVTITLLEEEIKREHTFADAEGKLRSLFGMGERSLTPKEKKCFSTWLYEFGFGLDIIRLAYDVTVDAKGSPNISYMNSVLANWNRDGLRTPEAIRAADDAHKAAKTPVGNTKKQPTEIHKGSFDTDDFFAAAVRRSFGDDDPSSPSK